MEKSSQSKSSGSVVRKRGRPAGKNRVPLTLEERRARNAGYERERREALGDAWKELRAAAGLGQNMSEEDLMVEVIYFLSNSLPRDHSFEMHRMRRCNENLASQITMLEQRLVTEPDPRVPLSVQPSYPFEPTCQKRKAVDCGWQCPPSKRFIPEQECWDVAGDHHAGQFPSQRVPWPSSEVHRQSPLVSHDRPSAYPLSCPGRQPSPAASCSEVSTPGVHSPEIMTSRLPTAPVSCSESTHIDVNREHLTELASVWTQALCVADGPLLSLSQMDYSVTEEELVSLYFSPRI